MHGIFIGSRRPKSKKEIKEIAATTPNKLSLENTSMIGNDFSGPAMDLREGQSITFVGPDPFTKRSFYGTIRKVNGEIKVS